MTFPPSLSRSSFPLRAHHRHLHHCPVPIIIIITISITITISIAITITILIRVSAVYHRESSSLVVCTLRLLDEYEDGFDAREDSPLAPLEEHFVKLYDEQTFEELDKFALKTYENACSMVNLPCIFSKSQVNSNGET